EERRLYQPGAAREVAGEAERPLVAGDAQARARDVLCEPDRAVGRRVVDQQQLEVLPRLRQQRFEQWPQMRAGVAARDGERGRGGHAGSRAGRRAIVKPRPRRRGAYARRRMKLPVLLAALLAGHLAFGLCRVPMVTVARRAQEIAEYRRE